MKSFLLLAVIAALLVFSPVEGCSRRRNNRPPNVFINRVPLPPFVRTPPPTTNTIVTLRAPTPTPEPTFPPSFAPTANPTAVPTETPTAVPTAVPTSMPTPEPTTNNFGVLTPTPSRGTTVQMERPKCLKTSEFRRQNDGQIREEWTYACSFNIYVTVDIGTITEPTPCACGVKLDNPAGNTGPIPTNQTTTVDNVRLVVYDEVTKQVKGEIPNFPFAPNANTTRELLARAAGTNEMDYSTAIAGFAGVAQPWPNMPAILNRDLPGQQSHVPAICFQVTQTFTTRYQWPEPPLPRMHEAPNIFATDCLPNVQPEQLTLKRGDKQAAQPGDPVQFFRDFLIFSRNVQTGNFVAKNRYITSFYFERNCLSSSGVVSFDRQFNSEISRAQGANNGLFKWVLSYTDVHIIAGAPKGFTTVTNYLSDGYYKISWFQRYAFKGGLSPTTEYADGLLRAALLGDASHPDCHEHCGKASNICKALPANSNWQPRKLPDKLDNEDPNNLFIFPAPTDGTMDCTPNFRRCDGETTWIAFQNFGASSRDFSKLRGSHLFTGPRTHFCSTIVSQVLDTLEFKPLDIAKMLRKRGEADSLSVSKRSIFQDPQSSLKEIGNSRLAIPVSDPVLEAIPQPTELGLQPATGSADINGLPQGDHPVELFREAYTAPISVKQDDTSCGTFGGGDRGIDDYCLAGQVAARPPCLPGQRGCSCRATQQNKCDLGLSCSETSFCITSSCPAGTGGCKCNPGNTCNKGLSCGEEGLCFYDSVNRGKAGYACTQQGTCEGSASCNSGLCMADNSSAPGQPGTSCSVPCVRSEEGFSCDTTGICKHSSVCNAGAGGCDCNQGSLCASGFVCKQNGMCGQISCKPGDIGCPCLPGGGCNKNDLKCKAMRADGSESACFGEALCSAVQNERCKSYCGANNVLKCPSCTYQVPICFVTVDSSATGLTVSVAMALVAILLALLF